MKAGLVGYPASGKTTLFNALTALHRAGHAQVHLGAIKVPDPRVEAVAELLLVRRVAHAEIRVADLPGARVAELPAEAEKTLGDSDVICVVLRGFPGLDGTAPDPLRDLRSYDGELALHDLDVVDRRLDRLRKTHGARTGAEYHELERVRLHLDGGRPLRSLVMSDAERHALAPLALLSLKPLLAVVNVGEADLANPLPAELEAELAARGAEAIALSVVLESEIAEMAPEDQPPFLAAVGLSEPARDRFIRAAHHLLDLVTFFTVGGDEVRAWTLHRGDKAPRAAGQIAPELERGFSRIDVTHYAELMASRGKARSHLEGKEYTVRDGDLLHVRSDH